MMVAINSIGIFVMAIAIQFWFCNYEPPWMFLLLDPPFEYWVEHANFGLLYVMFRFSDSLLGCSTGEFHTRQLIVLVVFGAKY